MADSYSLNSPRRILSLSKERATVSFSDPDDKVSGFVVSEDHGPKPSEVYGFVGSISTIVATVIFLGWAYIPEPWLHAIGITYYPSRHWVLAMPVYGMVTVVLAMVFYLGLNFMATPPPTSLNTIFDEYSRSPSNFMPLEKEDESPIEPIFDLEISQPCRKTFMEHNSKPHITDEIFIENINFNKFLRQNLDMGIAGSSEAGARLPTVKT